MQAVCEVDISAAVEPLISSFENGGKLLCRGNGGGASDSLHIVVELMKDFAIPRPLNIDKENALIATGESCEYIADVCI